MKLNVFILLDNEVDEQSITINDFRCVASDTIPNRRTPSREVSTDYSNESLSGDDRDTSIASASVVDGRVTPLNNRMRKNGTFTNWFNFKEEKLAQGKELSNLTITHGITQVRTSRFNSACRLSNSST